VFDVYPYLLVLDLVDASYFGQAALTGTLNLPMRYDELATLSPVVRKEVLTGELSRRVKAMNTVPAKDVNTIVESLVGLSLSEVVSGIQDPTKLAEQVQGLQSKTKGSPSEKSPSPSASQDSRLLDPASLNATASAPEHPSTPISFNDNLAPTPPRSSSPSGSVAPTSERDRILAAVSKLETSRQSEITDLIMSLPKRERAMCLFNPEILRAKIADGKIVLDSDDGEADPASVAPEAPVTPQAKKISSTLADSPQTPDLSSRGPSAASSPVPVTPGSTQTIASLARLPAAEIVRMANSSSATGLPLPKADPLVVKATDEFIDGLLDKPIQTQKQQLGDKL
jgi:polyadenylate-binding protein